MIEVNDHLALPVLRGLLSEVIVAEVAPVAVHLADRGHKVVHVGLDAHEIGIGLLAVLPAAVLPAVALHGAPELVRRHDVLPLNALGPVGVAP